MPVSKTTVRVALAILLVAYLMGHLLPHAHAQSSLGIGTNEATLPSTGFFAPLLNTVNLYQQAFYRSLTGALKAMRTDGSKLWILVGLSFAYGIFHAAGPGHGKAVISSYMLANEVALKRGILLSFISAFLQAFTAIDFTEDDMLEVKPMPAACTRQVIRPDPDTAIAQNKSTLTEAFFNDPTGTDLSKIFATKLELDCQAKG